jgi:hypothetical protein
LPSPSKDFIQAYIEAYNAGKVITDVLVEYEEKRIGDEHDEFFYKQLKIKDNTIIIKKKSEKVYTESEVIALCKKSYSRGHYNACFKNGAEPTLSNEWINENLK